MNSAKRRTAAKDPKSGDRGTIERAPPFSPSLMKDWACDIVSRDSPDRAARAPAPHSASSGRTAAAGRLDHLFLPRDCTGLPD